jgi:hypothetical protein
MTDGYLQISGNQLKTAFVGSQNHVIGNRQGSPRGYRPADYSQPFIQVFLETG